MKFSLSIIFFTCCFINNGISQNSSNLDFSYCLDKLVVSDSISIVLLGEDHSLDNTPLKLQLLKRLDEQNDKLIIALEFPRITQIYCNDYLKSGSKKAYKRLKKLLLQNKKDQLELLVELRKLIEGRVLNNEVKIICFDITIGQQRNAFYDIEKALDYLDDPRLDDLHQYIINYRLNKSNFDNTIASLYKELNDKSEKYESFTGANYQILLDAIDAVVIANGNGRISIDNTQLLEKREKYMADIIHTQSDSVKNSKTLVFTGVFHTSLLEYDTLTMLRSFNFILKNSYNRNTLSFMTIYYGRKRSILEKLFRDYLEFLYVDIDSIFQENPTCNAFVIESKFLETSPILKERCDAVIVKDCR